jgi:hypothetical protein
MTTDDLVELHHRGEEIRQMQRNATIVDNLQANENR